MEFKDLGNFEAKVDASQRQIEGYASVFDVRDSHGDIVERGAFAKTINERGDRIKVMFDHRHPIGKAISMLEDSRGLHTVSKISETPTGDEVLQLVKDNVLDMSIGYSTVKQDRSKDDGGNPTRFLKEVKLFEYSFVTFPSNESARVTGMKSAEDIFDIILRLPEMLQGKSGRVSDREAEVMIECAYKSIDLLHEALFHLKDFDVQRFEFDGWTEEEVKGWLDENAIDVPLYKLDTTWFAMLEPATNFTDLKSRDLDGLEGARAVVGTKTREFESAWAALAEAGTIAKQAPLVTSDDDTQPEPSESKDEPEILAGINDLITSIRSKIQN